MRSKSNHLFLMLLVSIFEGNAKREYSAIYSLRNASPTRLCYSCDFFRAFVVNVKDTSRERKKFRETFTERSKVLRVTPRDEEKGRMLSRMPRKLETIRNILGKNNKYSSYEARVYLRRILPRTRNDCSNSSIHSLGNREET